jgi:hypothetical protein
MSTKMIIQFDGPVLDGCISTAKSQCGTPSCGCKTNPRKLHGTYYRWTGVLNGKRTTKTIRKEVAEECIKRIKKYRILQEKIKKLLAQATQDAPWHDS